MLNAINLNTGEYAWKIPLGEYPELAAKGLKNTGSENYGGPIVTAGGLLVIGASNFDRKFRAFDKSTGEVLRERRCLSQATRPRLLTKLTDASMWS
jgi:quinoprotein glucose dehydrogenase